MILTLDASVVIKWHIASPDELDCEQALLLLDSILNGAKLVEPPHALTEVAAVLSRIMLDRADACFDEVERIFANGRIMASSAAYRRAIELSVNLEHHLFDTLYHAVAIESGATLVTADERYYGKAAHLGSIVLLENFGF